MLSSRNLDRIFHDPSGFYNFLLLCYTQQQLQCYQIYSVPQTSDRIARFEELLPLLADNSALEADLDSLEAKHSTLMDQQRSYMRENTRILQDQEEYNRRFAEMDAECKAVEEQITAIKEQILENTGRKELIRRCLEQLKLHGDLVTEFDTELWGILVESVTIFADSTLTFLFRDETTISGKLPEAK